MKNEYLIQINVKVNLANILIIFKLIVEIRNIRKKILHFISVSGKHLFQSLIINKKKILISRN